MIPLDYITEWRVQVPWPMSFQVEQDLILSDLFDLYIAGRGVEADPERVVLCFQKYLEHSGTKISRAEMEMNLRGKLEDPSFLADIQPLIASDVEWDPGEAAAFVLREFVSRIPGSPWKGAA